MVNMKWSRTAGRRAGLGDLLNDRWLVRGYARYWSVRDSETGQSWPEGTDCYFGSMREARSAAEAIAREEGARYGAGD